MGKFIIADNEKMARKMNRAEGERIMHDLIHNRHASLRNLNNSRAAAGADNIEQQFEAAVQKVIDECIANEKKKMDSMSRLELIEYAATTHAYLQYNFIVLTSAGERIKKLENTQDLLMETINRMIKKQSVKIIDRNKL